MKRGLECKNRLLTIKKNPGGGKARPLRGYIQSYFSTITDTGRAPVTNGGQICDCFPDPPVTTMWI